MPDLIDLDKLVNGMTLARFIASEIMEYTEYKDEEYYVIEDALTSTIQNALYTAKKAK